MLALGEPPVRQVSGLYLGRIGVGVFQPDEFLLAAALVGMQPQESRSWLGAKRRKWPGRPTLGFTTQRRGKSTNPFVDLRAVLLRGPERAGAGAGPPAAVDCRRPGQLAAVRATRVIQPLGSTRAV